MPTANARGVTFEFPEGTTESQMGEAIDSHFAQRPEEPTAMPPPDEKGFLRRSGDTLAEGFSDAGGRFGELLEPTENLYDVANKGQAGALAASDIVGAGASVVGDAVISAGKAVLPDAATDFIGDTVESIGQSAPVQAARDAWGSFEEAYPATAEFVGDRTSAATNMAGLTVPGKVSLSKLKIGSKLEKANKPKYRQSRIEKTTEDLQPIKKQDRGNLDLDERGNQQWTPSAFDKEIAEEVAKVTKYSPSKSHSWNQARLRDEATKLKERMEANIKKYGNPEVDMASLNAAFEKATKSIKTDNRGILAPETIIRAEELAAVAKEFVAASDGTALGLLNARRSFDKYIRTKTRGKTFDPEFTNALDAANSVIRDVLNTGVNSTVKGVDVKNQLLKQHKLLTAQERLLEKAWRERESIVGRFVQNVENKLGVKFPTTPLAAGATIAAGAGIATDSPILGASLGGVGALMGAFKGGKWLGTPEGKQWLVRVIKAVEKDPLMSRHKIDKATLVSLLQDMRENPDEAKGES